MNMIFVPIHRVGVEIFHEINVNLNLLVMLNEKSECCQSLPASTSGVHECANLYKTNVSCFFFDTSVMKTCSSVEAKERASGWIHSFAQNKRNPLLNNRR